MSRRQPALDEPFHALPLDAPPLAPPSEDVVPEVAHREAEVGQGVPVAPHSEVSDMPAYKGLQPYADQRNRVMHAQPQFGLHRLQPGLQSFADGLPQHGEPSPARLPAQVREAEKVEGFRLAKPAALSMKRRFAVSCSIHERPTGHPRSTPRGGRESSDPSQGGSRG
jgi:hypothetical protein